MGLGIAALALYLLVAGGSPRPPAEGKREIDDASRQRLERVLEEADREGDGGR